MDRMIHVALSSMRQAGHAMRVTTSNLANIDTIGHRADQGLSFQSVYLSRVGQGPGARAYATQGVQAIDTGQGPLVATDRELDAAINGTGYFVVQAADGTSVLSRRGDLHVAADGTLVNGAGQTVLGDQGPLVVPPYRSLALSTDGTVRVVPVGAPENEVPQVLGRLALVSEPASGVQRRADGDVEAVDGVVPPNDPDVRLMLGKLEKSNVNPVAVLAGMVELTRIHEAQSRLLKTASNLDESGVSLMRIPT